MNRRIFQAFVLALIIGLGIWGWMVFFPGPEKAIRRNLQDLARSVSFAPNEGPLAKVSNSQRAVSFCASNVEVVVDVPNYPQQSLASRDELFQAIMMARAHLSALKVEFLDINVTLTPGKESAVANLTARARIPGDREFQVQELKFSFKKVGSKWLIRKIETVKTLSQSHESRSIGTSFARG